MVQNVSKWFFLFQICLKSFQNGSFIYVIYEFQNFSKWFFFIQFDSKFIKMNKNYQCFKINH